ncbi:MAG TPA: hypothetical protein VIJ25_00270 [Methylococcales bacterium]
MEVDHLFICTEKYAVAGDLLVRSGFAEGSSNTHPGQGTANRRFFFQNLMLELLWATNLDEITSPKTMPLRLYERCVTRSLETCPFGLVLRPTFETSDDAPFPTWAYCPDYLPNPLKMQVGANTPLSEPNILYFGFARGRGIAATEETTNHKLGVGRVTKLDIQIRQSEEFSRVVQMVNKIENVKIEKGDKYFMMLEFDNHEKGSIVNFEPHLPLEISY